MGPNDTKSLLGESARGAQGAGNYQRIYSTVRLVPPGTVATYGQIAAETGLPGHARQVGYALHALHGEHDVPWHRVINAKGEVSPRSDPEYPDLQRKLLEAEGIVFDPKGRVSLKLFRWQPDED